MRCFSELSVVRVLVSSFSLLRSYPIITLLTQHMLCPSEMGSYTLWKFDTFRLNHIVYSYYLNAAVVDSKNSEGALMLANIGSQSYNRKIRKRSSMPKPERSWSVIQNTFAGYNFFWIISDTIYSGVEYTVYLPIPPAGGGKYSIYLIQKFWCLKKF